MQKVGDGGPNHRMGVSGEIIGQAESVRSWMVGAIDMHVHGFPDISPSFASREDDFETIAQAERLGIEGWVLKSHLWPSMDRANALNRRIGTDNFRVFSSIVLNPVVGGVSPVAVSAAAEHGARVVFMPTWGVDVLYRPNSFVLELLEQYIPNVRDSVSSANLAVIDDEGRILPSAQDIVRLCHEGGLVLCTGHLRIQESLVLARYATDIGYERCIITHPLSYVNSPRELECFEGLSATVEFTNAGHMNPRNRQTIRDVDEGLGVVGPARSILTTDVFSPWVPAEPECLRTAVHQLAFLGWSRGEIRELLVENPRRILGLDTSS